MNMKANEQRIEKWAEENFRSLGFGQKDIRADYIWNPGGFSNLSFSLTDGRKKKHVKFTPSETKYRLKQWAAVHEHLTTLYRAPKMVCEIREEIIPGFPYGLVFDFLPGESLDRIKHPAPILEEVLVCLNKLHQDSYIREKGVNASSRSCGESFADEYITRLEEDLAMIRDGKGLLNFVSESSIDWFQDEVGRLKSIVQELPSFQEAATKVVHNDLNWQNILSDGKRWWIIDWDDLSTNGDPAMDFSVLLWPVFHHRDWQHFHHRLVELTDGWTLERMELYFQAKLLDEVIDILADYIEAENVPEVKKQTQERAKAIHLRAFAEYKQKYKQV